MKIPGVARDIGVYCQGSIIKSFYINNGHEVAPFVIEKKYGNGKIIFVNTSGYFKTLSKYSDSFFLTLGNITDFIGLHAEKFTKTVTLNSAPFPYFIGDLNILVQLQSITPHYYFPKIMTYMYKIFQLQNRNLLIYSINLH